MNMIRKELYLVFTSLWNSKKIWSRWTFPWRAKLSRAGRSHHWFPLWWVLVDYAVHVIYILPLLLHGSCIPQVTKKQVDNFRESKLTPCCQLKAEVSGRRKKIPVLNHQVLLKGAKQSYNFFTLELPARGTKFNVLWSMHWNNVISLITCVDPNSQAAQTFGDLSLAGIVQLRNV